MAMRRGLREGFAQEKQQEVLQCPCKQVKISLLCQGKWLRQLKTIFGCPSPALASEVWGVGCLGPEEDVWSLRREGRRQTRSEVNW